MAIAIYNGPVSRKYDAGEILVTTSPITTVFDQEIPQILLYPTVDAFIKLNGSTKEIFLPALSWTPVSVLCSQVTITATESGKVYWQGWFM